MSSFQFPSSRISVVNTEDELENASASRQLQESPARDPADPPLRVFTHPYLDVIFLTASIGVSHATRMILISNLKPTVPPTRLYRVQATNCSQGVASSSLQTSSIETRNSQERSLIGLWSYWLHTMDMYNAIDSISVWEVPWQAFTVSHTGPKPVQDVLSWMEAEYTVWFRCPRELLGNQLSDRSFAEGGLKREYQDFMSGDWACEEADKIAADPTTHGALLCPVILGSDKTTVSVATGQNEYYPLYISNGVVSNGGRPAHRDAVSLCAFLAIPKTDRQYKSDPRIRQFRRQLFHTSLHHILQSLCSGMETPEVSRCADGHYCRVIWSLGPYIADYPEQVLLSVVLQGWCPRCIIPPNDLDREHQGRRSHAHTFALMKAFDSKTLWDDHQRHTPDLLHQIIKGTFKDHLVTWVEEYLVLVHRKAGAAVIMADIDRRIAAVPHFPDLRRFPQGRGFEQWTGDDSKALMKIQDALDRFHQERVIFERVGVRASDGFSLPRQHSLKYYHYLIQQFGAPNGLCSSITESKHIKAVKQPWRRSSRYKALGQMLTTNSRVDKLAAARVYFDARNMLETPAVPATAQDSSTSREDDEDEDAVEGSVDAEVVLAKSPMRKVSRDADGPATYLNVLRFAEHLRRFLYEQLHPHNDPMAVSVECGVNAFDPCGAGRVGHRDTIALF
ncbi:hypothetical protein BC629DRAFT_1443541 [Irpex lacteus]|nr:hypothetical protein BC629DRAFT_1443541 [Irpex lacteus]